MTSWVQALGLGLPTLFLAVVTWLAARLAAQGAITVGEFIAFYGYVLMLTGPMRGLGMALGMAQRAVAAGTRVFELLDRAPQLVAAPDARLLPPGGGRVELRGVTFGTTAESRFSATSTSTLRPAGRSPWSGRPAPARPRWSC